MSPAVRPALAAAAPPLSARPPGGGQRAPRLHQCVAASLRLRDGDSVCGSVSPARGSWDAALVTVLPGGFPVPPSAHQRPPTATSQRSALSGHCCECGCAWSRSALFSAGLLCTALWSQACAVPSGPATRWLCLLTALACGVWGPWCPGPTSPPRSRWWGREAAFLWKLEPPAAAPRRPLSLARPLLPVCG